MKSAIRKYDATDQVRIRHWLQETLESGRWVTTDPLARAIAERVIQEFERGEIVEEQEVEA